MSRNSDYQFVSTDTEALQAQMIVAYERICGVTVQPASPERICGVTVQPASPERLFIQWVASIILQERQLLNYAGNQNIPSRAVGENLDALAELFYMRERPQAHSATCTVRFYISAAQEQAVLVPFGTRVSDKANTLIWETEADAYIPAGETHIDLPLRCQTAGALPPKTYKKADEKTE